MIIFLSGSLRSNFFSFRKLSILLSSSSFLFYCSLDDSISCEWTFIYSIDEIYLTKLIRISNIEKENKSIGTLMNKYFFWGRKQIIEYNIAAYIIMHSIILCLILFIFMTYSSFTKCKYWFDEIFYIFHKIDEMTLSTKNKDKKNK